MRGFTMQRRSVAIGELSFVYATTARPRGMVKPVITPEQAGEDMRRRVAKGQNVGILFGRERFGLRNEEVALANSIVMAPVNPAFASLNVAQAVMLMGYEWFRRQATSLGQETPQEPAYSGPAYADGGITARQQGGTRGSLRSSQGRAARLRVSAAAGKGALDDA